MLTTFYESQMAQCARERFLDRVTDTLSAPDPDARAVLSAPEGRQLLAELYDRAHAYGWRTELDLARFLVSAWILGADFDIRYPAVAELMADQRSTPTQKAEALELMAATLARTLDTKAER